MAWQIRLLSVVSLSVVCDVRAPYSGGLAFRRYFLWYKNVAWPSGNSPTKNHEDRPRGSPPTGALNEGGRKKVAISDQYLASSYKQLKIDGCMLRCVWPALNPLFIHVTFTASVPGAYPGETKMCQTGESGISPPISRYLFIIQLFEDGLLHGLTSSLGPQASSVPTCSVQERPHLVSYIQLENK